MEDCDVGIGRAKFICKPCGFKGDRKGHLTRHTLTQKHLDMMSGFGVGHDGSDSEATSHVSDTDTDTDSESSDNESSEDESSDNESSDLFLSQDSDTSRDLFSEEKSSWFPFNNRLEYLLFSLRNSVDHPVSKSLFRLIHDMLQVVIEDEIQELPPFETCWKLRVPGDNLKPSKSVDSCGRVFYYVKPRDIIQMCLSNMHYAEKIQRYPRESGAVSEQNEGKKWNEDMAAPYASVAGRQYFIGDIVSVKRGRFGKVCKFFLKGDGDEIFVHLIPVLPIHMENGDIVLDYDGTQTCDTNEIPRFVMVDGEMFTVALTELGAVFEDWYFCGQKYNPVTELFAELTSEEISRLQSVTPYKAKSAGLPVTSVHINLFADDASGNRSKKWNPYHIWIMQLAGLPMSLKNKKDSYNFLATSNETPIFELVKPIVEDLIDLDRNGMVAYDALFDREVLVVSMLGLVEMDNALASEAACHRGGAANQRCRFCIYDLNQPELTVRNRTKEGTLSVLQRVKELATTEREKVLVKEGVKDVAVPLNDCPAFDCHRDIPLDLLHSHFLGDVKYLHTEMINRFTDNQRMKFSMSIEAGEWGSFPRKLGKNVVKYIGSSPGKDFKILVQVSPFHAVRAGADSRVVNLLCMLAKICKMVTMNVSYTDGELASLTDLYRCFFTSCKDVFSGSFLRKQKSIQNLHQEDCIRWHGCPSGYTTETGESWCGRVRTVQFGSNRYAPSRDTAERFCEQAVAEHIRSGGSWICDGQREVAGKSLLLSSKNTHGEKFMNRPNKPRQPGFLLKASRDHNGRKLSVHRSVSDSLCATDCFTMTSEFSAVKTQSGEVVNVGEALLVNTCDVQPDLSTSYLESICIFNRGVEVVCPLHGKRQYVLVKRFLPLQGRLVKDNTFGCQMVYLENETTRFPAENAVQAINVIHDCVAGQCGFVNGNVSVRKEHERIELIQQHFAHNENHNVYLINRFRFTHVKSFYNV